MKKLLSLLLAVCACLLVGILATACDEEPAHEHSYGEWAETAAPTCSTKGSKEKVCACGDKVTEELAALPHTEEAVTGKAATCLEAGLTDGKKCSVCQTVTVAQETVAAKGHSLEGGVCTVCGHSELSTTVDAAQWAALFTGTNLSATFSNASMTQIVKVDGNKQYDYTAMPLYEMEIGLYHEFVPGENIWYEYAELSFEGDWEKGIDDVGNGARMREVLNCYFYPFADKYTSFTYNEETGLYTAQSITATVGGTDYTYTNVCVKIENGALARVTFSSIGLDFVITEIGTTVVTLPTITYTVSADEWNEMVSSDDLYNLRVEFDSRTEEGECINHNVMTFHENAFELFNSHVVKQGDVWYYVFRDWDNGNGDYVGVVCDKDDHSIPGTLGAQLLNNYAAFTYDAENRCYVATDFAFSEDDSCAEVRVYVRNGKIHKIEQKTTATYGGSTVPANNTYEFFSYGRVSEQDATVNLPPFTIR